MTNILLILKLLFPWTFSVKGFAMAQEGKDNLFLVSLPASNLNDKNKTGYIMTEHC